MLRFVSLMIFNCYLLTTFALGQTAKVKPCDFCSLSVVINNKRADCFLEKFDARMIKLKLSNRGFVRVDLSRCGKEKSEDNRNVFGGSVPLLNRKKLANVLFLDQLGMNCLKKIVVSSPKGFNPPREILFDEQCK